MTEDDCVDATKLVMELFFVARPQDFLAQERLQKAGPRTPAAFLLNLTVCSYCSSVPVHIAASSSVAVFSLVSPLTLSLKPLAVAPLNTSEDALKLQWDHASNWKELPRYSFPDCSLVAYHSPWQTEQAERVYGGLVDGVTQSEDRLLLAAKISGRLVGVAEVSLPGGTRFGAEKLQPKAPDDFPYISDVAVSPAQRGRGIGKSLLRGVAHTGPCVPVTGVSLEEPTRDKAFLACLTKCLCVILGDLITCRLLTMYRYTMWSCVPTTRHVRGRDDEEGA